MYRRTAREERSGLRRVARAIDGAQFYWPVSFLLTYIQPSASETDGIELEEDEEDGATAGTISGEDDEAGEAYDGGEEAPPFNCEDDAACCGDETPAARIP